MAGDFKKGEGAMYEGAGAARAALACMDLTSLGDFDTEDSVRELCAKAGGPFGSVAAVCVWPKFASLARSLAPKGVEVAVVANFPTSSEPLGVTLDLIGRALAAGAGEIDLVFPYKDFFRGAEKEASEYVRACKKACGSAKLKAILESGCYPDLDAVSRASHACLGAGADFLKTSTGKIAKGADAGAARAMMAAIADSGSQAGFKASGGVRAVEDAALYLNLAWEVLGVKADPARFRIGASGLLSDIEARLGGGVPGARAPSSY